MGLNVTECLSVATVQTRAGNSQTETHLSDLAVRGRMISVGERQPTGAFRKLEKH